MLVFLNGGEIKPTIFDSSIFLQFVICYAAPGPRAYDYLYDCGGEFYLFANPPVILLSTGALYSLFNKNLKKYILTRFL